MIGNKKAIRTYVFLAAYKRVLGMNMEKAEIAMRKIEEEIGLTHPESIKLRLEAMDIISLVGAV